MLTWFADVLRAEGLDVREQPGWQSRGGPVAPKVVVVHHTAAPGGGEFTSLPWIASGSPIAPLANLHLSRSGDVWTVVAAGKTNNAGVGSWPPKAAYTNHDTIGIEAEHSGNPADPWPSYRSYVRGVAAICRRLGWDASHVVGHKEWSPGRKQDPTFDMDQFRADVTELLEDEVVTAPEDVRYWQTILKMKSPAPHDRTGIPYDIGLVDGVVGPKTRAALEDWQRRRGIAVTGTLTVTTCATLQSHANRVHATAEARRL